MYNGSYSAGVTSSYGSYYNWRVATAKTANESVSIGDHVYSICSKNWTLPTTTQAQNLISKLGNSSSKIFPPANSGWRSGNNVHQELTQTYLWTATNDSTINAHNFWVSSNWSMGVDKSNWFYYALTARCVVK